MRPAGSASPRRWRDGGEHLRATTTLSLVRSDGYALFSDPNPLPTPDHLHDWYPFWDKSLGKTAGDGVFFLVP